MQFELHIQRQMKSQAPTPGRAERPTFLIPGGGGGRGRAPDPAWPHLASAPSLTGARVKEKERDLRLRGKEGKEEREEEGSEEDMRRQRRGKRHRRDGEGKSGK